MSRTKTFPENTDAVAAPATLPAKPVKRATKSDSIILLMQRPEGATLEELVQTTGWLPHTTRAALTGLRRKGHRLERSRRESGVSVYRINSPEA